MRLILGKLAAVVTSPANAKQSVIFPVALLIPPLLFR